MSADPLVAGSEREPASTFDRWEQTLGSVLPLRTRRVLLATAGYGDGHNRAADAMRELIAAVRPEVECLVTDGLTAASSGAGAAPWTGSQRYYAVLRTCPGLYHSAYRALSRVPGVLPGLSLPFRAELRRRIESFQPDVVVATHVFCARAVQGLASKQGRPLLIGVVTDWLDDAYWNRTRLDRYWVAGDAVARRLTRAGIPSERIEVTGIPVAPSFYDSAPKDRARRELGLASDRFTVLILGGGLGMGRVREAARAFAGSDLPVQVAVVAGRNEELRSRVETLKLTSRVPIQSVGFTDRMHDYMSAADLAVTKPGGVTIAECLAKQLPMVFLGSPLPGPETLNEGYLLERGLAVKLRDERVLVEWVRYCVQRTASRSEIPT